METKDLKEKIKNEVDNIPEDALEALLDYLKSLSGKSKRDILLSQNLSKILEEDQKLLQRLAK
jgi:hypothetical protein